MTADGPAYVQPNPEGYVAGSVGPTSRLPAEYEPLGDTTDEEYFETFREQAEALAEGGVDLFAVETMMFPQEAVAAVRACKTTGLPVMATMFFQYEELHDRDRTMWGESPAEVAKNLLAAGADAVGMNCGRGPDRAIVIVREMRAVTEAPLVAYLKAVAKAFRSNDWEPADEAGLGGADPGADRDRRARGARGAAQTT